MRIFIAQFFIIAKKVNEGINKACYLCLYKGYSMAIKRGEAPTQATK
jgi:hypothetical protein